MLSVGVLYATQHWGWCSGTAGVCTTQTLWSPMANLETPISIAKVFLEPLHTKWFQKGVQFLSDSQRLSIFACVVIDNCLVVVYNTLIYIIQWVYVVYLYMSLWFKWNKKDSIPSIDLSWKHLHQWKESHTYYGIKDKGWIEKIVKFPPNYCKMFASINCLKLRSNDWVLPIMYELDNTDFRNLSLLYIVFISPQVLLCNLLFQNQELSHDTYECRKVYRHWTYHITDTTEVVHEIVRRS